MILVKPTACIVATTAHPLGLIERAGRVCYKSESKITAYSALDFMAMLIKRGHESVLEHANATVQFICDRGVSHELVRHRIASFSQESTRYCDYHKDHVAFVIPPWVNIEPGEYAPENVAEWVDTRLGNQITNIVWAKAMAAAELDYHRLRQLGWKPEQTRSVLPNSLKTELVMTANLREWRHFFKLRTAPAAHPQMREVTIPLLKLFQKQFPVIFDDIQVSTTEGK